MTGPASNINPEYKRNPAVEYNLNDCVENIQEFKILSYLISKSESTLLQDKEFVRQVISKSKLSGSTRRIAISGAPGVGKSTFINSVGKQLADKGKRIAVLPVDPSSLISKGSILGDKTRMEDLIGNENVFIKPMASSLSLGGVAPATQMASLLCACAEFDYVFIETVGVGQSEYEVRHLVDLFLLLLQPGGGDDLQGIKRGIMEIADLLIVNKCDGPLEKNAQITFDAYANALKLMQPSSLNWKTKIKKYSSLSGEGIDVLFNCLDQYFTFLSKEDRLNKLRKEQSVYLFEKTYELLLQEKYKHDEIFQKEIGYIKSELVENKILLFEASEKLKQLINEA